MCELAKQVKVDRCGFFCDVRESVGHAFGNWRAQVWDLHTKTLVFDVPHSHMAGWIGFTPDETEFLSLSGVEGYRTSLATGARFSS